MNDDKCMMCGKTMDAHDDIRPVGAPMPRVPCAMLKSGFIKRPVPSQPIVSPYMGGPTPPILQIPPEIVGRMITPEAIQKCSEALGSDKIIIGKFNPVRSEGAGHGLEQFYLAVMGGVCKNDLGNVIRQLQVLFNQMHDCDEEPKDTTR